MNVLPLTRTAMRAALHALLLLLALTVAQTQAWAQERIKGELAIATDAGFLRLIFRFDEEVTAKVRISGAIMVVSFDKPINVAVDRINASAPDYVSASRLDPDGKAIRIGLARRVKVNSIPAAERFYVDVMPDNWAGVLPGLPQEVVDDLSRRTREAERQLKSQRMAKQKQMQTIRVRVATQPTFVRYVFDVPEQVNAMPDRGDGKLTVNFDQQIKWDLADAKAALPSTLESIEADTDFGSSAVTFTLNGTPDVRTFREEGSVVVDVGIGIAKPKLLMKGGGAAVVASPPETVPAIEAPEAAPIKDAPAAEQAVKPASPASPPPLVDAEAPAPAKTVQASGPQPLAQQAPVQQAPMQLAAAATKPAAAPVKSAEPVVAAPAVVAPAGAPAVATAPRPAPNPDAPVVAIVSRDGGGLKIELPFALPTPSAVFRRADVLWMVFDSPSKIDVTPLMTGTADLVRSAEFTRGLDGEGIVRMRLARPLLTSLDADGPSWIVNIGETVMAPSKPLTVARTTAGKGRASIAIPFADPARIHRMGDPGFGDQIMVVTALGPARGFIKSQDFVELRTLASTHGVVIQPIADDIAAELSADKITIGRPGGLSISPTLAGAQQQVAPNFRGMTFDTQLWGFDRQAKFSERQAELIRLAASAPPKQRKPARFNLARFYLAQEMPAEAKAVLDVAMADDRSNGDDITGSILRSIANVMLDR
ncbi:MAG TPA: hypothetical protein VGM57_16585, partial [Pseudolabrys sp.]